MPQSKKQASGKPSAKRVTPAKRGTHAAKRGSAAASAASTDARLRDSLAELRTTLTRGVLLTRERINETLEDAVRRGRMTRDDAEDLTASLMGGGRRQAQELLADVETLLGSSRRRTAESTDAIVRQVDKARRAAGLGTSFPILGYDELTAAQIAERLSDLTPVQLRKVRDHERRHANRKSVLTALDRAL